MPTQPPTPPNPNEDSPVNPLLSRYGDDVAEVSVPAMPDLWANIEAMLDADERLASGDTLDEAQEGLIAAYVDGQLPLDSEEVRQFEAALASQTAWQANLAAQQDMSSLIRQYAIRLEATCTLDVTPSVMAHYDTVPLEQTARGKRDVIYSTQVEPLAPYDAAKVKKASPLWIPVAAAAAVALLVVAVQPDDWSLQQAQEGKAARAASAAQSLSKDSLVMAPQNTFVAEETGLTPPLPQASAPEAYDSAAMGGAGGNAGILAEAEGLDAAVASAVPSAPSGLPATLPQEKDLSNAAAARRTNTLTAKKEQASRLAAAEPPRSTPRSDTRPSDFSYGGGGFRFASGESLVDSAPGHEYGFPVDGGYSNTARGGVAASEGVRNDGDEALKFLIRQRGVAAKSLQPAAKPSLRVAAASPQLAKLGVPSAEEYVMTFCEEPLPSAKAAETQIMMYGCSGL